jgi:hypothetical protein
VRIEVVSEGVNVGVNGAKTRVVQKYFVAFLRTKLRKMHL